MLTQAQLKTMLRYNQRTGVFTWVQPSKYRPEYKGREAGSLHKYGYVHISIRSKSYKAHRLAWLYVHGEWPAGDVDHKNGARTDNRIANLRVVDRQANAENRRTARSGHTTGFLGVVWRSRNQKYEARIAVNKKYKYLGLFATPEEAHAAYVAAKRQHHAGCTL